MSDTDNALERLGWEQLDNGPYVYGLDEYWSLDSSTAELLITQITKAERAAEERAWKAGYEQGQVDKESELGGEPNPTAHQALQLKNPTKNHKKLNTYLTDNKVFRKEIGNLMDDSHEDDDEGLSESSSKGLDKLQKSI